MAAKKILRLGGWDRWVAKHITVLISLLFHSRWR